MNLFKLAKMLLKALPKLPMRDKTLTKEYYIKKLGFKDIGQSDFHDYLIIAKDEIELHFFRFEGLNPKENDGQVYIRVEGIEKSYEEIKSKVKIHPNGGLQLKPWGQKEFSILDPDNNLLTFGERL